MTLYGLDFIVDPKEQFHLIEVNGIRSGMRGFEQIYGDNRVEETVHDMLTQKYGKLTINDGTYRLFKLITEHPTRAKWIAFKSKIMDVAPVFRQISVLKYLLSSNVIGPQVDLDWLMSKPSEHAAQQANAIAPSASRLQNIPTYVGQESTVVNWFGDKVAHDCVNNPVCEEITRNKLLAHALLDKTPISHYLQDAAYVGHHLTDADALNSMLSTYEFFIKKPLLGAQGKGVSFHGREHIRKAVNESESSRNFFASIVEAKLKDRHVEKIKKDIAKGVIDFELGLSMIQPFVPSYQFEPGKMSFSCIRAIVCNGQFVDAYRRTHTQVAANLATGASAHAFSDQRLPWISEYVVSEFEKAARALDPKTYRQELYSRIIPKHRESTSLLANMLMSQLVESK